MGPMRLGDDHELMCPGCGSEHLHHEAVTVFSRYEDQDTVALTTITPATREQSSITTVETTDGHGNPSGRRHGLRIRFSCEGCGGVFGLTMAQHKGQTFVEWEATPKASAKV